MINNVKESMIKAKSRICDLLALGEVPCTYMQSGREMMGSIIDYEDQMGNNIYLSLRPDIRVRSSTGKDYPIMLTSVISIKGIDEL
tara:strand:+ start:381 stop:638 length:258 start_codon:yes stop_codon:yes gene_type:complete